MNLKHPRVSPHKSIWYATIFGVIFYCLIGILGGLGFSINKTSNLLQQMYSKSLGTPIEGWMTLIYILFPIFTYLTSIPVAMIVVRLNFRAAKLTSEGMMIIMQVLPLFTPYIYHLFLESHFKLVL
jgi:fumarate reductase subunit D